MVKRANTVGSPDVDANGRKRLRDTKVVTSPAESPREATDGRISGSGATKRQSAPNTTSAAFLLRLREAYLSAAFAIHGSPISFRHPWRALRCGPPSAILADDGPPLRLLPRPLTRASAAGPPWPAAAAAIHGPSVAATGRPSVAAGLRQQTNLGVAGPRDGRTTR